MQNLSLEFDGVFQQAARDAFTQLYPAPYREVTESIFSERMRAPRISLTAALFRQHVLPISATNDTRDTIVLAVLRAAWRRDGLKFPDRFELVLCHGIKGTAICTGHAGLLIPREKGYTYIEKSSISGPFVRLDFDDRTDLYGWLAGMSNSTETFDAHYVTFNDVTIQKLETGKR